MGRGVNALDLQKVWLRRRQFAGRVAALFETIDLLLIPAQPMASPTMAQMETLGSDPNAFEVLVKFTAPFNTTGSPTMTFPAGFTRQGHAGGDAARGRGTSTRRCWCVPGARSSASPTGTAGIRH